MREGDASSIRPNSEKCGLTEGEDAGIAPKDVHRERSRGVEEGAHEDVDGVGVEERGRCDGRDYTQSRYRPSGHEPASKGPPRQGPGCGGEFSHCRTPRAGCAEGGLPELRWSVRRSPG